MKKWLGWNSRNALLSQASQLTEIRLLLAFGTWRILFRWIELDWECKVLSPIRSISILVPFAACTWSPPMYLSWTVSLSNSPVIWSVALESMYQCVSTPYEVIAEEAHLGGGGPVNDASNRLKHLTTWWPSLLQSWQNTPCWKEDP